MPVSRRGHHFKERANCGLPCYIKKKGNTGMKTRILMSFKKFNDSQKDKPCTVSSYMGENSRKCVVEQEQ